MEFTTHTTRFDILRLRFVLSRRNPWVILLSAILSFLNLHYGSEWVITPFRFILYFLLFFFAIVIFDWLWICFIPGVSKGVLGEHKFWVKEDGLFEKTSYNETLYPFRAIRKVILNKSYIVIQLTSWTGFFIARREFANEEEEWKALGNRLFSCVKKD